MLEDIINILKKINLNTFLGMVNLGIAATFIKLLQIYHKKQIDFQNQQISLQKEQIDFLNSLKLSDAVKEIEASRVFYEEKKTIIEEKMENLEKKLKIQQNDANKRLKEENIAYQKAIKEAIEADQQLTKVLEDLKLTKEENESLQKALKNKANKNITENRKYTGRLLHEMKLPLVAIRGAAEFLEKTEGLKELCDYDYLGDIWSWTELMGRLIDNADLLSSSTEGIQINPIQTWILADVIAPAIKQVKLLLRERDFSYSNIRYDNETLMKFPRLWLDRNRFQQVIFNLLSNAIKYAYDDPKSFRVEIAEGEHEAEFTIWFRDWGLGIENGMEERIFEKGVRGENAVNMNVTGQGMGLWIVRQIVEKHGGTINVTNPQFPTEFEIRLPVTLTSRSPV